MSETLTVLGIVGSLRKASLNRALLRACIAAAPADMKIVEADISGVPLFNEDIETPPPAAVLAFRDAVVAADGLLFACPEYNYAPSGVLKNAIDWLSRGSLAAPGSKSPPIFHKCAGVIGAAGGMGGTQRAQMILRPTLAALQCHAMAKPEIYVPAASTKFAADGTLTDEATKKMVADYVVALAAWIRRMKV